MTQLPGGRDERDSAAMVAKAGYGDTDLAEEAEWCGLANLIGARDAVLGGLADVQARFVLEGVAAALQPDAGGQAQVAGVGGGRRCGRRPGEGDGDRGRREDRKAGA
jgi:hypothetical protein